MGKILVTRAMPEAEETANVLISMGYFPLIAPLRRVETLDQTLPRALPAGLIATSRKAFAGAPLPAEWRALPLHVVGENSAKTARLAGFAQVFAAKGDAESLIAALGDHHADGARLVYLAGSPRSEIIEKSSEMSSFCIETIERYRMVRLARFPEAAVAVIRREGLDAVLHFSAESAQACFDLAEAAGIGGRLAEARHVAISRPVAEVVAARLAGQSGADARLAVAASPDHTGMIACLASCAAIRTP
jgi:uroporphyrinogen-III synthase